MKLTLRQKTGFAIVLIANLLLWIIPSNVVEQIARDHQTMLGRYSRQHFSWIVAVLLMSIVSVYIDLGTGEKYKRRWFQVIAVLLFAFPGLLVIDYLARNPNEAHYIRDHLAYHRPPNGEYDITFEDKPEAYRTYPSRPPGHAPLHFVGHTDKRGYRNLTDLERYDIVVLGDSFAGGSRIPDETLWPAQLADASDLTVYNLGTSGYAPIHYLASLKRYGLGFQPRYVLCLLYEGNDFRSAKADRKQLKPSLSKRLKIYFKQSPLITGIDSYLIHTFGPIRSIGPVRGIEMLDWMPLAVPPGADARYYAFAPKQLRDLYRYSEKDFAIDRHWLASRSLLKEMDKLCRESGARFVVIYAPTKAHVVLPIVSDRLPADHVRAFTQLRVKQSLPKPDDFLETLLKRIEAKENVVRKWCKKEGIAFIGITDTLRESARSGTQVYFTYDQHWAPEGHRVVAEVVQQFLSNAAVPSRSAAATRMHGPHPYISRTR